MSRKRTEQQTTFTGVNNGLPQLRSQESLKRQISDVLVGPSSKRTRVHSLRDYFNQSMLNHLNAMIEKAWSKSKANEEKYTQEVDQLKTKSVTPRLPAGILKDASNLAGCEYQEMVTYMDNNGEKLNKLLWKDFFDANVDIVVQQVRAKHTNTAPVQSTTAGPSIATAASSDDDASSETAFSEADSELVGDPIKDYRTCSVSMNKILRADLPDNIKEIIFAKLNYATQRSTDYALNYYLVLHLLLLKFREGAFTLENQTPVFRDAPGFDIAQLLPAGYVKSEYCNITHSALPIPASFFASTNLAQDFDLLFQKAHLRLVHSYYFGAKGAAALSLSAHPVQSALFESLTPANIGAQKYNTHGLSSSECKNVSTKVETNIGNMWKNKKIFKHLLNKLLHALLSIHLAPDREARRQEVIAMAKQNKGKGKGKGKERATPLPSTVGGPSTAEFRQPAKPKPFTRNALRNIRRGESKKIQSYRVKKVQDPSNPRWDRKIQHCESRVERCYHLYKNSPHSIEKSSAVDEEEEKVVSVED
ncbi:unnamed protein product [Mucor fragilis]